MKRTTFNPEWLKSVSVKEIREKFKSDKQKMNQALEEKKAIK